MDLKLEFNNLSLGNDDKEKEKQERAKAARQKKKDATETTEEAFERIGTMALDEKQQAQLAAAIRGHKRGIVGRIESGKMTKGEALSMGKHVMDIEEQKRRKERIKDVINHKPANYHILRHDSELPAFMERVREEVRRQKTEWDGRFAPLGVESMTAGDYEGTGVDTYIDLSVGFGLWLPLLNEGYYLPYGHVDMRGVEGFEHLTDETAYKEGDAQLTRSKVLNTLAPYLSNPNHGKAFHMGSTRYDLHIAINDGYEIHGCVWDTLDAMKHLTEHLPSYGLKQITERYGKHYGMGGEVTTFEDLFGNGSPAPYSVEVVGIYGIKDVEMGWRLFEFQYENMKKTGRLLECYAKIDSHLPETDVYMARSGFVVDLEELAELERDFTGKIEEAKQAVREAYNMDGEFIYRMNKSVQGDKIEKWLERQQNKRDKAVERLGKAVEIIAECEANDKMHLKKYSQAIERKEKAEQELAELASITPQDFPDYATEFEFTNNNHIGFLIYDFLGIEDKTSRVKRGKTRSTAADVLQMYYDDEENLKPLATVAEYEKLLNTYVRKIPEAMEIDGRFHCTWKSAGTSTGRYSSSAYNGRRIDVLDEFIEGVGV